MSKTQKPRCAHCGFCNATCPTYLLTGNELEGPRGRIYLMKTSLEGHIKPRQQTLGHIDSCLGCLSCETTCPSGVDYSRLLEEACPRLEKKVKRSLSYNLLRSVIARFRLALNMSGPGPRAILPLLGMAPKRLLRLAEKANAVVERVRDVTEVVAELGLGEIGEPSGLRIAYHDACSLQHGQHIENEPRTLLQAAGFTVLEVPEGHICCGSAGAYNMLQSEMA